MRLFHVSEESDIPEFVPRVPSRADMDRNTGLVWAIDERHLPNFLTPRNCPRVCFMRNGSTTEEDADRFLRGACHVVTIDEEWLERLRRTTLYLYEFDPKDFTLQDPVAGYYVSAVTVRPLRKITVTDLQEEIRSRGAELRTADGLISLAEEIKRSSFDWSLCRMGYAKK